MRGGCRLSWVTGDPFNFGGVALNRPTGRKHLESAQSNLQERPSGALASEGNPISRIPQTPKSPRKHRKPRPAACQAGSLVNAGYQFPATGWPVHRIFDLVTGVV